MPVYTAKELASILKLEPKNVHTYVGRSKLIKRDDGLFDTSNPINAQFLEQRKIYISETNIEQNTTSVQQKSTNVKQKQSKKSNNTDNDTENETGELTSVFEIAELRASKLKEEVKQLQLKNQKLEGLLIEVDLIQNCTLEVVKSYRTTLYIYAESIVKQNMIDLSANNDQITKAVADLSALFNKGCSEAIENVKQSIDKLL